MNEGGFIQTVAGPCSWEIFYPTDAHTHLRIEAVEGKANQDLPVLNDDALVSREMALFHGAGGRGVIDCQPGGCGRNALILRELTKFSQVQVACVTGFHRRRYYPEGHWLWGATIPEAQMFFKREIQSAVLESEREEKPIRAAFIKGALESSLETSELKLLEAAVQAAAETGAALALHTEQGKAAEAAVRFVTQHGLASHRLILFHMDKRPDIGLHRELADAGVLLEYDTFYRPRYDPEHRVWPLLEKMLSAGKTDAIALGTDMADAVMWGHAEGSAGLMGLMTHIRPRLSLLGFSSKETNAVLGGNIAQRIARTV